MNQIINQLLVLYYMYLIIQKKKDWYAVQVINLFDAGTRKKKAMPNLHIVRHIEEESKVADYLALWLD